MDALPSSIETYLEEAGFSGTEILILRRLMDGEPLTIRQLGAKTGKSTGVLDQAMKKLMKKNIIKRTFVNDTPKYFLDTMETVVEWMQEDMEQKRDMLLRRHQNFESFVTSLESGSKRPDIEYFEGESGIKQAYIKLLNGPGEILHYLPVTGREEEDPLRDFRVQYFRERQQRKMFSRVLTHNTPLGRRYHSRDVFEYRKTVLVPEAEYPFTFEKIITGDRIACIDHTAKTACVIRYPELADIERTLFEAIWRQVQVAAAGQVPQPLVTAVEPRRESVSLITKALSTIREFFLSPRSLAALFGCMLLAAGVTYSLYRQNVSLNTLRIQERVKSIAATAALQFDARDVDQIWSPADIHKPEYAKMIHLLNRIRRENTGVKYAYVLRPTEERGVWKFVVDADALDPFMERDVNGDGAITDVDHLAPPGETYIESSLAEGQVFLLQEPAAYDPTTDQWGTVMTGSAPIRAADGRVVGIIGVDVEADDLSELIHATFWPIASFVGFLLLFLLIRYLAFNRVLMGTYVDILKGGKTTYVIAAIVAIAVTVSIAMYAWTVHNRIASIRNRILTVATTGALQFSAEELEHLRSLQDTALPGYVDVVKKLHDIRAKNENIKYAYLIRPRAKTTTFEFIADADAYQKNLLAKNDINHDGIVNESDEIGYPGLPYDVSHIQLLRSQSYYTPTVTPMPFADKWGAVFTGYAPIRDTSDAVVALLAIDVSADAVFTPTLRSFFPLVIAGILIVGIAYYRTRQELWTMWLAVRKGNIRSVLYALIFLLMIVYWVCFSLYFYTLHLKQEEMGKRLMAIAATAASEFKDTNYDGKIDEADEGITPGVKYVFGSGKI